MRLLTTVLVSAALLTACGSSDTDKDSGSSGAPGTVGGSTSKVSGSDDGSGGIMLKTLAKQLTGSLAGGESYEIKDKAVTIKMSSKFDEGSSYGQCAIVVTARDGVGETAPFILEYTDRDLDCDTTPE